MNNIKWLELALKTPYKEGFDKLGYGFDCFGLIKSYYKEVFNIQIPDKLITLRTIFKKKLVPTSQGDILILYGKPLHVVMYWGEQLVIHTTKETYYPVLESVHEHSIKNYKAVYEKKY